MSSPRMVDTQRRGAREVLWRLGKSKLGIVGIAIVFILVLSAILSPILAPKDPGKQDLYSVFRGPSFGHPLGTDELGRDVLSRLIYGSRITLQVGILCISIAAVAGVSWGLISGYRGGWIDNVLMRLVDTIMSFPGLVLALAISAALGPGLRTIVIAISIVMAPGYARIVRGQVLSVREQEFVTAARAIGANDLRIISVHIFPNVVASVIVQASLGFAYAVLAEAGLTFLGLGVDPATPSWGGMLRMGYTTLQRAPWVSIAPGTVIFLAVLAFNFLGDALRDALDPRLRV